jgi:hypothetical protein
VTGHKIGAVFLLALGAVGIYFSRSLPLDKTQELGTSFFPTLISGFLLGLALFYLLLLFWKGERSAPRVEWAAREGWIRIVLSLVLFSGYIFTLERVGFLVSTFLLILLFARMIFQRPWKASGILAFSSVLASYVLLTVLLQVRLPESPWGW